MNKKQYKEFGKAGAKIRWATRYQMLDELRKFVDVELYPLLVKWPTVNLKTLLQYIHKNKLIKK